MARSNALYELLGKYQVLKNQNPKKNVECELESMYEFVQRCNAVEGSSLTLDEVKDVSKTQANESSLFNVFISAQMTCAKSAHIVSIKLMYNMRDNGSCESIESIRPFETMFQ